MLNKRLPALLVLALMAAYALFFSLVGIRQHDTFLTNKEDLGQIDQAVWNSLHGRLLVETDEERQSTRLTDHVEPVLAVSSLVFLLWDDARALLAWQALVAALGAWAIYLLARDVLLRKHSAHAGRHSGVPVAGIHSGTDSAANRHSSAPIAGTRQWGVWLPVLFAFIYLMMPALQAAHLAEFHASPLASAPVAFALLFLRRRQWRRFALAALVLAAVKEEMALAAAVLAAGGLVVAWRDAAARGKSSWQAATALWRHPALAALALSLAWFALATFAIIPAYGAGKYAGSDSVYFKRYGELGATPAAVVRTLLTDPALVWRIAAEPSRVAYVAGLVLSSGAAGILAPELLLLSLPLLMANVLSNFPAQYSGDFHYSAALVPYFAAASVVGFARAARWLARIRFALPALAVIALLSALLYHRARGYTPLGDYFTFPEVTAHHRMLDRFAAQIPRGAPLAATPALFPHLSHREVIYLFPAGAGAEYFLLDAAGTTDMHPNDFRAAVNNLLATGKVGVQDAADGYLLLRRGAGAAPLPDAFYDFARASNPRPQVPLDAVFGDSVRLLGYDIVPDPRWHRVSTRWYWQALKPLDADLTLYPFYLDDAGKVIEDTSQRPMVAVVWYPPSRWRVGETVRTETIPWDVGDRFSVAAGVIRGNDWDRIGRRLATPAGMTQVIGKRYLWQGRTLLTAP